MAEENTVTMTVENIDRLFSEIVVNGESHVSENYVPPVQLEQVVPQTVEDEEEPQNNTPAQVVQGQDVHAVDLNNVLHDFVDPSVTQGLANEIQTRQTADTALQNSINTINSKIPNQASAENQLADKNFVNSSIATNTANFLGTYTTLQEIEAIPNPTNNDYAFLATTDSAGNTLYDRYKYSGEDEEWHFEYELNNSGFTAEQWATINSGLTQQSVDEDIQEAISQVGSGIEVYDTEEEMEEDLPNKQDDDLVGTLSADDGELQDAPLGSVMSYLGTTDPSDGKWLICDGRDTTGTAIELETHYPSLFMFLGGTNVLPLISDKTELDWNNVTETTISDTTEHTMTITQDGCLFYDMGGFNGTYGYVSVNGVEVTKGSTNNSNYAVKQEGSVEVKKGDIVVYKNGWTNTYLSSYKLILVPYKHYKIIKAVSSVDTYNMPSSEIAQVEQYVDEGINTIKNNGLSYSITETLTGGTWIDGKPIYRKVVDCGELPNNNVKSVAHNITNIDKVIKIYGVTIGSSDTFPLPYATTTGIGNCIAISYNSTNVTIRTGVNRTGHTNTYITLEYTKTTD